MGRGIRGEQLVKVVAIGSGYMLKLMLRMIGGLKGARGRRRRLPAGEEDVGMPSVRLSYDCLSRKWMNKQDGGGIRTRVNSSTK